MRGVRADLTGKRFGHLIVLMFVPAAPGTAKGARWLCVCDCGQQCIREAHELTRPAKRYFTPSCGCRPQLARDIARSLGSEGGIVRNPDARRRRHRVLSYD